MSCRALTFARFSDAANFCWGRAVAIDFGFMWSNYSGMSRIIYSFFMFVNYFTLMLYVITDRLNNYPYRH